MQQSLVFDLDGTLTDPKVGITRCIQFALAQLGEQVPEPEQLLWCIGPPLLESFERMVGPERAGRAVELYRDRFATTGLFENEMYVGINEVLAKLNGSFDLYIASSKPLVYVTQIIQHFSLEPHFNGVFGSELDGTNSDKSELLHHVLETTKLSADQCIMIGDRRHDAVGANSNAMDFIGVLYGYGSIEEFRQHEVADFVHTPQELVTKLIR